ncbi:MAG: carbamoyltransferase N-terminal domain-containing protein [Verrucomicrobiota bacterium]
MFLGLNAFCHDSSACLVGHEGAILCAVEEERFSRVKREKRFPASSIRQCLEVGGISPADLDGALRQK